MKTQHGRDLTGEEMAELVGEFVNGAGAKELEAFATQLTRREHRTLQQSAMNLFMVVIEAWAKMGKAGNFDLRNEGCVTLARKIMDVTGYAGRLPHI